MKRMFVYGMLSGSRLIVAAHSMAEVVRLFNEQAENGDGGHFTSYIVKTYGSETKNVEDLAVALNEPGTVFARTEESRYSGPGIYKNLKTKKYVTCVLKPVPYLPRKGGKA